MSRDESNNNSLRELVRQSLTMQELHKKESDIFRNDISMAIAKIDVHNDYTKKKLEEHSLKITVLDAYRNKTLGFVTLIGMSMGAFVGWVLHLLSK